MHNLPKCDMSFEVAGREVSWTAYNKDPDTRGGMRTERVTGTLASFLEAFESRFSRWIKHYHVKIHQRAQLDAQVDNLKPGVLLTLMDWSADLNHIGQCSTLSDTLNGSSTPILVTVNVYVDNEGRREVETILFLCADKKNDAFLTGNIGM